MEKIDIPVGETFMAPDKIKYKVVNDGCVWTCRGCAFMGSHELCHRFSCISRYRKDRKTVHFVECKEETKKGE